MIFIDGFGFHGDSFSGRIEQHSEHGKYCVQVYRNGERAEWFGWCDSLIDVYAWIKHREEV